MVLKIQTVYSILSAGAKGEMPKVSQSGEAEKDYQLFSGSLDSRPRRSRSCRTFWNLATNCRWSENVLKRRFYSRKGG
jgi:hypothetical protein